MVKIVKMVKIINKHRLDYRHALVILWLIFTVALTVWLFVFTRSLFSQILSLQLDTPAHVHRHMRMIQFEMISLLVALVLGGGGLLYLIHVEKTRSRQIREFFATFTHELKTSLASLRLQAEAIEEDLQTQTQNSQNQSSKVAKRLLGETTRLEMQLENSLFLARDNDETHFFIENVSLSKIISSLKYSARLQISLNKECSVKVDSRAIESVFKNIIQNSVLHGQAQNLWIEVLRKNKNEISITIKDDGKGCEGTSEKLGHLFARRNSRSGSGIGLYIVKKLIEKMKGSVHFLGGPGFAIKIDLPGEISGEQA